MLYGPTTPLQPAAPTPKDIVESEHMVEIIQRHSVVNRSAHVLSYVESVAYVMVTLCNLKRQQQQRIESGNGEEDGTTGSSAASNVESYPTWAKAFAFGSSGLEANVTSSDIDVYVGRVPNLPPCPLPFSPPFLRFKYLSYLPQCCSSFPFIFIKTSRVSPNDHSPAVLGCVPGDLKAARDRRCSDSVRCQSPSGEVHAQ